MKLCSFQRVLDYASRPVTESEHQFALFVDKSRDQLSTIGRVRFTGGDNTTDPFRRRDVGDGSTRGECPGNSRETGFAAEFACRLLGVLFRKCLFFIPP
jgi:hypothetical protein